MPSRMKLRVGDLVRIVSVPEGDLKVAKREMKKGMRDAGHTAKVLQEIVDSKRIVKIFQIDEYKMPWFSIKLKRKSGRIEQHWLSIMDDDSWEKVKKKSGSKPSRDSKQAGQGKKSQNDGS